MGAGSKTKKRGVCSRFLVIPCVALIVMLMGFFVVNMKFMAVDLTIADNVNAHYQESNPQVPILRNSETLLIPNSPLSDFQKAIEINHEPHIESTENKDIDNVSSDSNVDSVSDDKTDYVESKSSTQEEVKEEAHVDSLSHSTKSELEQESVSAEEHSSFRSETERESHSIRNENHVEERSETCSNTPLSSALQKSTIFTLSDFDCSTSNQGWRENIPPPLSNSTRSEREWKKRIDLIEDFGYKQDHYDFDDEEGKYIVFWPIFAGIGNNLAVFSEVLMIAILSNRKFLSMC